MNVEDFDYKKSADAGVEVELKHPVTGAALDAWITVHGRDSARYAAKTLALKRRRLELMARAGADGVEHIEAQAIELLAACTSAWRGICQGGQPLVFSDIAAVNFYTSYEVFRDQVDAAIHTRALFSPAVASS